MKRTHLALFLLLCLAAPRGLQAAQRTPRYTNAQLVSIDAQTRLVVIKNTEGEQETLQLDDGVAGLEGLRAGDAVVLSLRGEPGMTRITSIAKSQASSAAPNAPTVLPSAEETIAVAPARSRFADEVAALARQADQVDALWVDFATTCNVTPRSGHLDGRDWFSLWEGALQMDVSSGGCRDLFNQVVARGEAVKAGMVRAEEAARKAGLAPGDLRDARRRYSMEWGGFGLPAPPALKP